MKDFDNDNLNTNEINEDTKREESNAQTFEDSQKGSQANEEGLEGKEESNAAQEGADDKKEADNGEQGEAPQGEAHAEEPIRQQYSSCYTPPYYVPNFTIVDKDNNGTEDKLKKKKKNAWKMVLVSGIVLAVLLVIFAVGLFTFLLGALSKQDNGVDMSKEQVTVIQNAPQVSIVQNTDPSYVPQSLPELVSKVGNSVVEIKTSSRVSDKFYGQYVTGGAGSGVIVTQSDEAGYLITNHHVIHNEDNSNVDSITVVLTNGEEYEATEIGSDYSIDLAVLRIEKKADETFTVAQFGDSSKLVVGQDVVAIGNPLGSLGGTVTDGIISALDRYVQVDDVKMVLLQHNAAINPGNSGGALFDMMGNLVGIVNAKTSDVGIEGLGFAIPANIAFNFFNRVMVTEPAIGIRVAYGRPEKTAPLGVYVVEFTNNEFKQFDRIIKVNGQSIENTADYYAIIDACKAGDTVTITVERSVGKQKENLDISVVLPQ